MSRQWIDEKDLSQLGVPVAGLSRKGQGKIVVKLGDSNQATPHQWRSRKEARKWLEALTVVPVWRKGVYYDYLYEGIALRPRSQEPIIMEDEVAFEGDLVEPSDPFDDEAGVTSKLSCEESVYGECLRGW